MTVSPALFLFLRRATRWAAVLALLAGLGFATAAALMFFWILPNIADHRDTVASLMSRALGQRVTLEAVSGAWQQARPEFRLQGVRLHDSQDRPALFLPELNASFAWRSLFFLEPRFNHIELQGLTLGVRRAQDGRLYAGGVPVNPSGPDSGFSSWLLRQGRVHLGQATITWLDEVRNAPPLILRDVDLTLGKVRRTHQLHFHAIPPAALARPLTLDAKIRARDTDNLLTWNGAVDVTVAGVSFPELATWLTLPYQPGKGSGAMKIKLDVVRGTLAGASGDFDMRAVETSLGEGLPELRLDRVRGQAKWLRGPDDQRVTFENLRVAHAGASLGAPFDMGLAWNDTSREINVRAFELSGWQTILPSLPMDEALRARLQTLQPQGRFDDLSLRWSGAQPGIDNFAIATHFSNLGVAAVEGLPGLARLSGRIEGDARRGRFEIDSRQLALDLPRLFREPVFGFDSLQAQGGWEKTKRGRRLILDEASFANADLAGTAQGQYELIPGQRGVIDLAARLSRANGTAVYRYLPKTVGDHTVDWVKRGVVAGVSDSVVLNLKGDLAQFPFEQGNGVFQLEAQVKEGIIDYVPDWPRIEDIQARLLFRGKAMEITSTQARIYGVALSPVKAVIPDLIHHEEVLNVEGDASGPVQDFIRYANFSPVGERLRGFTDALDGSGSMKLALKLRVPLRHSHDTTLSGRLSFLGNTLFPASLPRLDQVRGNLDFTGSSIQAKNLTAQFLGGPLRIDTVTRNGQVQILAQGQATATGLAPWLGPAWGKHLRGQTRWNGQIDLDSMGERIRIDSDLAGLRSSLPAPLAKLDAERLPFSVTSQPQGDGQLHAVRLGQTVSAVWRSTAANDFERGEIRFGGPAEIPAEPGLKLSGSGHNLDISGWMALLPEGGDRALPLSGIDLGFDALDLMGRRYLDVRLQGRVRNGVLRTQVTGRGLNGTLTYRSASASALTGDSPRNGSAPMGPQSARVSVQFKQLTIPAAAPATGVASPMNMKAADFPVLDMTVEDFRLEERSLGRLEATAHGAPQGLVIDSLQLSHADSVLRMSGLWRDGAPSETRADLSLTVLDASQFLARFGYPDTLKRGRAEIQGNATWVGSPADFAFDTLAGQLDFKASAGQFLMINPGAGKLLGVLSLQSLPRRLNFDFRDIFNQGYAFDDINATLRIARGVIYSDDFRMRGPAAKVNMSGMADLNQESVQLRVKVIPKLSESVAVAGALIGGPLAGVGALAAQKLLRDPFEEAVSREYMVTGAWQSPDVKKLSKTQNETTLSEP